MWRWKRKSVEGREDYRLFRLFNDNEKPERIVDGDVDTKWCEVGSALNYVDFDLGEAKTVSGWKLVNAGREDKGTLLPLASCKAETARLKNGRHLTI